MKNTAKKTTTKSNKSNKAKPAKKLAVVAKEEYQFIPNATKLAIKAAIKTAYKHATVTIKGENSDVKTLVPLAISVMRDYQNSGQVVDMATVKRAILVIGGHKAIADNDLPKRLKAGDINPEYSEAERLYKNMNNRIDRALNAARLVVNHGPLYKKNKKGEFVLDKNGQKIVTNPRKGWIVDEFGDIKAPMNTLKAGIPVKDDLGKTMRDPDGSIVLEANPDKTLQFVAQSNYGNWVGKMEPGSKEKRETKKTKVEAPSFDIGRITDKLVSGIGPLDMDYNHRAKLAKFLNALCEYLGSVNEYMTDNNIDNPQKGGDLAKVAKALKTKNKSTKAAETVVSPKKKAS